MSDLIFRVRFPLGAYDATGTPSPTSPTPEWPPAPERVTAAGLAGQAGLGITAVDALYAFEPPIVVAPEIDVTTGRNGEYVRYVPLQTLKPGDEKRSKVGDNVGVMVDPNATIEYVWRGVGSQVDLRGLSRAYERVAYLGRPTSAVVIDVVIGEARLDPSVGLVLVPDEGGSYSLSVPTPRVLADRRRAHAFQVAAGRTNVPNRVVRRHRQGYRRLDASTVVRPGGRKRAYDLVRSSTWYPFETTTGLDRWSAAAAGVLASGARGVMPVVASNRLLGVLADVSSGDVVDLVLDGKVDRLRPKRKVTPDAIEAISMMVGTSTVWTTNRPVVLDDAMRSSILTLGGEVPIADAIAHREPLGVSECWPTSLSRTNVTVMFQGEVHGPLYLNGVAMTPSTLNPSSTISIQEADHG